MGRGGKTEAARFLVVDRSQTLVDGNVGKGVFLE